MIINEMDATPLTPEEAYKRIVKAEQGIAAGEVVLHEKVMKDSYRLVSEWTGL